MKYVARVLTAQNDITELHLDAQDDADARRQINRDQYTLIGLQTAAKPGLRLGKKRNAFSVLLFSQELLALLNAGLSLIEALEGLVEKEGNSETQTVVARLLDSLREGKRFSTALSSQPQVFSPLYIGLIQAAENTSNLPQTLQRYIDYQQRIDTVGGKVISACIYPVILLLVGGGVTVFLVGFVVPRFASVYQGAGRNLPLLSQWLLSWGEFAANNGKTILVAASVMLTVGALLLRNLVRSGRMVDALKRIPALGERYRIYLLSRLYLTLGMLLQGGMPIMSALSNSRSVLPAEWVSKLATVEHAIDSGGSVSQAFATAGLTTPITVRMLKVGEQTGELGSMLCKAAEFYEGDLSRFIERFMRTFEPALMAAIGLVVGLIVVLLYMPIFELAGSLQ